MLYVGMRAYSVLKEVMCFSELGERWARWNLCFSLGGYALCINKDVLRFLGKKNEEDASFLVLSQDFPGNHWHRLKFMEWCRVKLTDNSWKPTMRQELCFLYICLVSFNFLNKVMRSFPFSLWCRWGNWGSERLGNSSKVKEPEVAEQGIKQCLLRFHSQHLSVPHAACVWTQGAWGLQVHTKVRV